LSEKAQKRITRLAVQARRQEIEQRIGACGLARGPRRLLRDERAAGFERARSHRLRLALEDLGPIFSAFGLYLSARPDLWAVNDCLEFGAIPDFAAITPAHLVRELFKNEIGCPPEATFSRFEANPFESRLLFQSHHARLRDGTQVVVKIIHPELQSEFSVDVELLPVLKDAFAGCGVSRSAFTNAEADFSCALQKQMDFANEVQAFEALARDAEDYDVLRAPRVQKQLSSPSVLVVEKLEGTRLSETTFFKGALSPIDDRTLPESFGFERNELARLLCEMWLRQAMLGRAFSVEPRPENVLLLPGKQLTFTDGAFATLPAEPQANLWNYLVAAANDQPDKACSFLLRELRQEGTVKADLLQRFRQAMPFRDGGWDTSGDCQTLAELLFVQWRFASQCGFRPLMHLPSFFRGLFTVAEVTRRIARGIDPLAEGIRDLRLLAGLAQFSKMLNQRHLAGQFDKYSALMMDMPQTVDEALTSGSEDGERFKLPDPAGDRAGAGTTSAVVAALLLVLAAAGLLSHYVTASMVAGPWANRINTIVFLVFGALLLRATSRVR
jgi:predicted unusual protein kinase regulating ubiquinone biosynthesis (AarF/ABC1/UbiB family)